MPEPARDRTGWIRGILDRYEGPLTLYATRIVGDVHRARDVVQDAFLRLLREDADKIEARLSSWLYTVTRNRAIDVRRTVIAADRAHRAARNGAVHAAADPTSAAETRDDAARALDALAHLPESQQEALRLRIQHGLSYDEIAEVMGTTKGNVAVLAHRGLAALRERLGAGASRVASGSEVVPAREGEAR
jgi:RNA polymerase sigma-70 factor (ECF subfamily)